jgi:hypothetical protein
MRDTNSLEPFFVGTEAYRPIFENAQKMGAKCSDKFYAPTISDLLQIRKGSQVKVCTGNERFWVVITKVNHDGSLTGEVNNYLNPEGSHRLDYGSVITFETKHIYDIMTDY